MTTVSVDVIVNQTHDRFRNEVMRSYLSVGGVSTYSIVATELNPGQSFTVAPERLLVLSFTGQLLIQLEDATGQKTSFTAKDGSLVLPFKGRVTCTPSGTATNPRVLQHVAL